MAQSSVLASLSVTTASYAVISEFLQSRPKAFLFCLLFIDLDNPTQFAVVAEVAGAGYSPFASLRARSCRSVTVSDSSTI